MTTDVVVTRVGRGVTINVFIHGSGRFDADLRDEVSMTTVGDLQRSGLGRVGDPGFEPGTSSLSEKRSNRLS